MKLFSNRIKELQINEWTVKEGDEKIVTSWAARKKAKYISSQANFKKFKKFFEELGDCAGLGIALKDKYDGSKRGLILPYIIRENEPNKISHKWNSNQYGGWYTIRTYKGFLDLLFNEDELDIHTVENVINSNYVLCLWNIEDPDDIKMLKENGFYEVTYSSNEYNSMYYFRNLHTLEISFSKLYENIDKLHKLFFE